MDSKLANPHSQATSSLLSTFAMVSFLAMLFAACSSSSAHAVTVEPLGLGTAQYYGRHLLVDGDLWIRLSGEDTSLNFDDWKDDQFIQFDIASQTIVRRIPLPSRSDMLLVNDDSLYTLSSLVEDGVPETGGLVLSETDYNPLPSALVKIDLETGEPSAQHPLGTVEGRSIMVEEDSFWFYSFLDLARIDIDSGESHRVQRAIWTQGKIFYVDGHIWTINPWGAFKVDATSEQLVAEHRLSNLELGFEDQTVRLYDGSFWITGSKADKPAQTYQLNIGTNKLTEVTAPVPIPTSYFEQDNIRWECCFESDQVDGPDSFQIDSRPYQIDSKATWTRVDIETGRTLGEYRFGGYEPFAEHDGYLLLRTKDGLVSKLGRVALSELEAS